MPHVVQHWLTGNGQWKVVQDGVRGCQAGHHRRQTCNPTEPHFPDLVLVEPPQSTGSSYSVHFKHLQRQRGRDPNQSSGGENIADAEAAVTHVEHGDRGG